MKLEYRGNLMTGATRVGLVFVVILAWPALSFAQVAQSTPIQKNPDDPASAFGDTNKAEQAAAQGIPGSTELSAPVRERGTGHGERMIVVDPAKERKERENAHHDPTFDGSGLFADIKPPPSATPRVRVNSTSGAALGASGTFLGDASITPIPSLSPSERSAPVPQASPTATAVPHQGETPSPTPSASPRDQKQ